MKIIMWVIQKLRSFFSSKTGKVFSWIAGLFGGGAVVCGGAKVVEAVNLNKRAKKIRDEALTLHEEHYNKAQTALETAGQKKLAAIQTFSEFANLMEKLRDRPRFSDITEDGVSLPTITTDELKVIADNVAAAIGGVALAGAGAGLGIAAYGLNVLAFGPGMLFGGVGMLMAGNQLKNKAVENKRQAKQLANDIEQLIGQYDQLANAADSLSKQLDDVYSNYIPHLEKMKKILEKKTIWDKLSVKEQRIIKNAMYLVGMMYKLCKTELVLKTKKAETVNVAGVKAIEEEVEKTIKPMKKKLWIFG